MEGERATARASERRRKLRASLVLLLLRVRPAPTSPVHQSQRPSRPAHPPTTRASHRGTPTAHRSGGRGRPGRPQSACVPRLQRSPWPPQTGPPPRWAGGVPHPRKSWCQPLAGGAAAGDRRRDGGGSGAAAAEPRPRPMLGRLLLLSHQQQRQPRHRRQPAPRARAWSERPWPRLCGPYFSGHREAGACPSGERRSAREMSYFFGRTVPARPVSPSPLPNHAQNPPPPPPTPHPHPHPPSPQQRQLERRPPYPLFPTASNVHARSKPFSSLHTAFISSDGRALYTPCGCRRCRGALPSSPPPCPAQRQPCAPPHPRRRGGGETKRPGGHAAAPVQRGIYPRRWGRCVPSVVRGARVPLARPLRPRPGPPRPSPDGRRAGLPGLPW